MQVAKKIMDIFEQEKPEEAGLEVIKGRKKARTEVEEAISRFLQTYRPEDRLMKKALVAQIEQSPLYIEPANNVGESKRFGWNRGMALKLETIIRGRWISWLNILHKQKYDPSLDEVPDCTLNMIDGTSQVQNMLRKCMEHAYNNGYRGHDFMEWLGYSLGIAWFEKPKVDDKTWRHWYETFDLSLMLLYPSDYLSLFLIDFQGQSGVGGYYPTPLNLTKAITLLLSGSNAEKQKRVESVFEPCLGAGAMLLPSESLNLVGADFNISMVKAASIQAFLYQPWLLYVPHPIVGIHLSESEMRVNRYFEFDTNTRIYYGDSLLGEYTAPPDIFAESNERVDIYLQPLDLWKNSALKWEKEFLTIPWEEMTNEMKWEIVKAQARNLNFEVVVSNPPFGAANKYTVEQIKKYQKSNEEFLAKRKTWLDELNTPHLPYTEEIIEHALHLIEEKTGQLAFF
jgi:hypothetical protein